MKAASMREISEQTSQPPVFIFTCGPQAGGHLLQQMVSSSREVLIWSGSGGALHLALESLRQMDLAANPAVMGILGGARGGSGSRKKVEPGTDVRPIVGNLRLSSAHLWRAYRTLFRKLYEAPSLSNGFKRWGLLEPAGDKFAADMLKLLFPAARFVFVVRNPLDCLREIRARKLQPRDRQGAGVAPARRLEWFATQWAESAREFSQIDFGIKLRYEDVVEGKLLPSGLGDYLQIAIPPDFLATWNAGNAPRAPGAPALEDAVVARLMPILREQMRQWSYA
jgi:hypothetical protein